MRRAGRTAILAILFASGAATAMAETGSTTVHINQSRRILLHGAAASVIVSDPAVADVTMIDAHSVILQGKGYGQTDVLVIDRAGRTLLDDRVLVTAPDSGMVTLHRGVNATDYTCAARCQPMPATAGGAGPAANTSVPNASPPNSTPPAAGASLPQ
jgi:hypothetical protein